MLRLASPVRVSRAELMQGLLPNILVAVARDGICKLPAVRLVFDLAEGQGQRVRVFRWKKQDQIVADTSVGLSSQESGEL